MELTLYTPPQIVLYRRQVLSLVEGLPTIDRMVCETSLEQPIEQLTVPQNTEFSRKYFGALHMVIGLGRPVTQVEAEMLFKHTLKFYPTLSWPELKLAFELLYQGELDQFLPKNGRGEPERNHYRELSIEFFDRVIVAYKKRKNAAWYKAEQKKKVEEKELTGPQVLFIRAQFLKLIIEAFEQYREQDVKPWFTASGRVVEILGENGYIAEEDLAPGEQAIAEAKRELWADKDLRREHKVKVLEDLIEGSNLDLLNARAISKQNQLLIMAVFDRLIAEDKPLILYLKTNESDTI